MNDVIIKKDEENFRIGNLEEYIKISFNHDPMFENSFKVTPESNDFIIKDDFLLAIINLDILTDLNIPTTFLQIISKKYWINS